MQRRTDLGCKGGRSNGFISAPRLSDRQLSQFWGAQQHTSTGDSELHIASRYLAAAISVATAAGCRLQPVTAKALELCF